MLGKGRIGIEPVEIGRASIDGWRRRQRRVIFYSRDGIDELRGARSTREYEGDIDAVAVLSDLLACRLSTAGTLTATAAESSSGDLQRESTTRFEAKDETLWRGGAHRESDGQTRPSQKPPQRRAHRAWTIGESRSVKQAPIRECQRIGNPGALGRESDAGDPTSRETCRGCIGGVPSRPQTEAAFVRSRHFKPQPAELCA